MSYSFRSRADAADGLRRLLGWLPEAGRQRLVERVEQRATSDDFRTPQLSEWLRCLRSTHSVHLNRRVRDLLVDGFEGAWPRDKLDLWSSIIAELDEWAFQDLRPQELTNIRYALAQRLGRDPRVLKEAVVAAMVTVASELDASDLDTNRNELAQVFSVIYGSRGGSLSDLVDPLQSLSPRYLVEFRRALDRSLRQRAGRRDQPRTARLQMNEARGPLDEVERREATRKVADAIATLSNPLQLVIRKRLAGLTHQAIGDSLGMPLSTVYRLYREAVSELLSRLPADLIDD